MFLLESNSTSSLNIHIFLPSGVAVIGIDLWVQRFTKLFNRVSSNQEAKFSASGAVGNR